MAWTKPAFPFDSERFLPRNAERSSGGQLGFSIERSDLQDTFELLPSGRIDRVSTSGRSNKIGILLADSAIASVTLSGGMESTSVMNTSYSDFSTGDRSTTECGPSHMTAAEIEDLVSRTAQSYGVDPKLAKAIIFTESRFDRNRNSPKGARGPMQLVPATASELGVDEICDPASNIDGGVRHLKLLLEEFQNPILAAAAYNAGAQAVYDSGGVPPFSETIRYVADVINHQMGLQVLRQKPASGNGADSGSASTNKMANDVIGARGGRFIKGVMQF
jgi:hypothetical protein